MAHPESAAKRDMPRACVSAVMRREDFGMGAEWRYGSDLPFSLIGGKELVLRIQGCFVPGIEHVGW